MSSIQCRSQTHVSLVPCFNHYLHPSERYGSVGLFPGSPPPPAPKCKHCDREVCVRESLGTRLVVESLEQGCMDKCLLDSQTLCTILELCKISANKTCTYHMPSGHHRCILRDQDMFFHPYSGRPTQVDRGTGHKWPETGKKTRRLHHSSTRAHS